MRQFNKNTGSGNRSTEPGLEARGQAGVNRRDFLLAAVATGVLAGMPSGWAAESEGGMIYRRLGRTGERSPRSAWAGSTSAGSRTSRRASASSAPP